MKARPREEVGDPPPTHHGKEPLELGDRRDDEVGELVDRYGGLYESPGPILLEPAVPASDRLVGDQEAAAGLGLEQPRAAMSCRMAMRSQGE